MYVRTYVRTYVSVTLRNVNLRSTLGMSICAYAQAGYRIRALHDEVGTTFLADGRRGGQRDWPFATYVFAERSAQTSAERSPRLPTLRKKKAKKSAHRRKLRERQKNKKEFKSRKHVLEIVHKPGI